MSDTTVGKGGERFTTCPICAKWLAVSSWPDDTRRRYPLHTIGSPYDRFCPNSEELIAAPCAPPARG